MTNTEYKQARIMLGFSVKEWLIKLNISEHTHKSVSCGRKSVPPMAAAHIYTLIECANKNPDLVL